MRLGGDCGDDDDVGVVVTGEVATAQSSLRSRGHGIHLCFA